jgi:hypothetical protein
MEFLHMEAPASKPVAPTVQAPAAPGTVPLKSLTFLVTREPFSDYFLIHLADPFTGLPNGMTEELDTEEAMQWFKARGAYMPLVDKAMDHCWNFARVAIEITNYKEPPVRNASIRPRIS